MDEGISTHLDAPPKMCKVDEEIQTGRLCLLRNETMPPTKWPLARVERLLPGPDGQVRVVELRTATSSYTCPVSKLVLLPVGITSEDDACDEEHR